MVTSIVGYIALGLFLPVSMFMIGGFLGRNRKKREKEQLRAYESGTVPVGDTWRPQMVRYYRYALLFVIFDAEVAFLYPWVAASNGLPRLDWWEALVFVVLLLWGLAYAWRKGAMEWI
ncbi:NADH:quinone oxidoreductase subunit A [Candidatus Hydrogenisulfobacillus filiaventi]|uniref:NADH-quinone oxidoreductase subunit n=1 Tax=Candidatus Hydrogenisulfobacillus filiaventi TaxID=2707344 RepID=A0A6F8ZIZ1_9FIRM|nr:NADH-quinone oxidoreductase subunit A [Bacillota bacterium]CAB1129849.1 NADH:quinone oxidoreductase subunit A [Candidatus Hydrogenisulfobacillus filiaventi]